MALDIELKEDSSEKLAAVAGKPTKHYLFAPELNQIVEAVKTAETDIESLAANKQEVLISDTFGAICAALPTEDDIQDSDKINFTDSSDTNNQKKTTWLNIKAKLISVLNALFVSKVTTVDVEKVYIKNADGTQSMKPTSELGGEAYNSQYDFTHFYRGGCGFLNNFGSIETGQMYSPLNYGLHGIALKTAANNTPSGLKTSPVGNMNGFTVWGQFYFYELTMSDFFSTIGFLPFSLSYAYIEIDTNTKKIRAKTSLNGVVTTSPDSIYTVVANVMYLFVYEYISTSEIKFKVLLETTKEVVFSYTSTTNIPALGQYGHFGFQQQRNPNTFAQMTMLVFDSFGMAVKKPNFLNNF